MKSSPILFYHNVLDNDKSSCSIQEFDNQMNFLHKKKYKSLSIDDLHQAKKEDPEAKVFSVTFDDGYQDNLRNALPILKKYNFIATCFIVYECIGKTNIWDVHNTQIKQHKLMNQDEISNWIGEGMNIGSHGINHVNLSNSESVMVNREIGYSKKLLEDLFLCNINSFCYPFGSYDLNCIAALKKFDYKYALTTNRGRYIPHNHNTFEIPRIPIGNDVTLFKFYLKMLTIYEDL